MSVPESQRGKGKFDVIINALYLAQYTITITKNKNIFLPEYQSALTDDLIRSAKDIYINAWKANNIRVTSQEDWKERKHLQELSILECNSLLATMQLAKKVFHLKSKRTKYWGELTIKARDGIRAWKESDTKRYKNI